MTTDELRTKLAKIEPSALVAFLARLAEEDSALRERIETLVINDNYFCRAAGIVDVDQAPKKSIVTASCRTLAQRVRSAA